MPAFSFLGGGVTTDLFIVMSICYTFSKGANCMVYYLALCLPMKIVWLSETASEGRHTEGTIVHLQ